jgi:hypothetical protein
METSFTPFDEVTRNVAHISATMQVKDSISTEISGDFY